MIASVRTFVAPAFLLLCLLIGGSAQGVWRNTVLQILGAGIIAWAAIEPSPASPSRPARQVAWIIGLGVVWSIIQLVPIPFGLWSAIGPRAELAQALDLVGAGGQWMPLSVAPYDGFATLLTLIPPIALYCAIERLHAYRTAYLVAALVAGTLGGILLGSLQLVSGDPLHSPFYLYPDVNVGQATGFFANGNHMASLLLVTLPFVAALARSAKAQGQAAGGAMALVCAALALVVIVGVIINGSLAAYLLLLPVAGASLLIALDLPGRWRRRGAVALGLALIAGAMALNTSSLNGDWSREPADPALSRAAINRTTAAAVAAYMPFGSGLGTYRPVYERFEETDKVRQTRSSHAHDDYLELALELGLPGVFLLLLFLYWWGRSALDSWTSPETSPYVRAASVATAAILAHSLVDFPLRTAAISGVFAMCLAFLADRVKSDPSEPNALRPTRHLSLD